MYKCMNVRRFYYTLMQHFTYPYNGKSPNIQLSSCFAIAKLLTLITFPNSDSQFGIYTMIMKLYLFSLELR